MKIRSITFFCNPHWPLDDNSITQAGNFVGAARQAFANAGYEVQTARLATVPFPELVPSLVVDKVVEFAQQLERAAVLLGFDYIAIGPAQPDDLRAYALIPEVLAATENIFASALMSSPQVGVSLPAVRACAEIIERLAPQDPNGFANLYFAALANVPPGAPFFPAAYHVGDAPAFALALESADLAVEAFSQAANLADARQNLISAIEIHAQNLTQVAKNLAIFQPANIPTPVFGGIDFSLAPYPEEALSLGTAFERLGVPAVGLHGSLAAAAIIADTIDKAKFARAGFSGLMLPVLEDFTLAARAEQGVLTLKDMLLYSAVCGTGLDTIPLPGDTTAAQLAPVLLDLAALAQRLNKPLTARLMPIPGKHAGDVTSFDFPFFANSRVMALDAAPLESHLAGDDAFFLNARKA
ncbi:MAG: DUF711 family protein [Chloroflexi bacterium]|jgi:uncharacterized protein|nr:DUF711 family protein [Chloroflexota bacterium]